MYIATIDCGTTNSRVYIVNDQSQTIGKAKKKVGVKDTAITGSNEALKNGLKDTFYDALSNAALELKDIMFVLSSGMITSEIGLLEIPHLWAPVSINDLAYNIKTVHDASIFPVDIPLHFIRGIKNTYNPKTTTFKDVGLLDFMRGEETQVAGLLSTYDIELPTTIVVLSSHTKFISIDKDRKILGSITTVSGQVYEAIIKETFIGKSIRKNDSDDHTFYIEPEIIEAAHNWVTRAGFLRSMLIPRFLDVLLNTKWYERKLFVEAAIAAEDMRVINQFKTLGFPLDTNFVLIGAKERCFIYRHLLREKWNIQNDILTIIDPSDIDMLSVNGSIYLARIAGLL